MSIDCCIVCFYFFFFQAEDGIRDVAVTGVQTCALPICQLRDGAATVTELAAPFDMSQPAISKHLKVLERAGLITRGRSEERRVGKECRSRWSPNQSKKRRRDAYHRYRVRATSRHKPSLR